MSTSVCWRPTNDRSEESWGVPLKSILQRRFNYGHSLNGDNLMTVDRDGEWLQGVIDAANTDQLKQQALELQEILQKHGEIILEERG